MRGHSTSVSELHSRSCPPQLWPGLCSDYLCHLKEVRREQYSQGCITSDVPAPLEIQAVRDLVRARGKEMQAENLNAQVAAQVCMDLMRGPPCFWGQCRWTVVGWHWPGSMKLASLP